MLTPFLLAIGLLSQDATPPDAAEAERLEEEGRTAQANAREAAAEAEALAEEIARLQRELVTLGQQVSASEADASRSEAALERLAAREAEILDRLEADRDVLIDVLAAIQRVETQTPPALLAAPEDAAEAARAAALMAEIAPALQARAERLRDELDSLDRVRDDIATERESLSRTETSLGNQRTQLEALIAQRRTLEADRRSEAANLLSAASAASERAETIRILIAEIARMAEVVPNFSPRRRPDNNDIPAPRLRPTREMVAARAPAQPLQAMRFADARGQLRPPATGPVSVEFGGEGPDGVASEGIFIRTRPGAQVVSPFDARVEFAGPFNTYGGLLILNVGGDYYIVLAGMAVTYASAGQEVLAGEPVGAMGDRTETASDLYLELRRDGIAIDPAPWVRFADSSR